MSSDIRQLSVSIDRPAAEAYEFLAVPENFAKWASGLGTSLRQSGAEYFVRYPGGAGEGAVLRAQPLRHPRPSPDAARRTLVLRTAARCGGRQRLRADAHAVPPAGGLGRSVRSRCVVGDARLAGGEAPARGLTRRCGGKGEGERSAFHGHALHFDPRRMQIHDALDDGKPQARAPGAGRAALVDAIEALEDVRDLRDWNAASSVGDAHLHALAAR